MKRLAIALAFVAAAIAPALSQAVTPTVFWTQGNVATIAQAGGFTYRLYTTPSGSTTQGPAVVVTGVVCVGTAPIAACSAPLPVGSANAVITGAKTVITSQDTVDGIAESGPSSPFTAGSAVPSILNIR